MMEMVDRMRRMGTQDKRDKGSFVGTRRSFVAFQDKGKRTLEGASQSTEKKIQYSF